MVFHVAQHSLNPEMEAARPSTAGEEELQLQLALAMSKEEHEEDERKKRSDDVKLHMALEESKKEEVRGIFGVTEYSNGGLVRMKGSFSAVKLSFHPVVRIVVG